MRSKNIWYIYIFKLQKWPISSTTEREVETVLNWQKSFDDVKKKQKASPNTLILKILIILLNITYCGSSTIYSMELTSIGSREHCSSPTGRGCKTLCFPSSGKWELTDPTHVVPEPHYQSPGELDPGSWPVSQLPLLPTHLFWMHW
jgi:hypothetical protein